MANVKASRVSSWAVTCQNLRHLLLFHATPIQCSTPLTLSDVPEDIVFSIVEHINLRSDILSLGQASSYFYALLVPTLFSSVELMTNRHCKMLLNTFLKRPGTTRHIRKLVVHPNPSEWSAPEALLDESWVAHSIQHLATNLPSLRTFIWDGKEMPNDQIWLTLRTCCPNLKSVGCSVGLQPPNPNSHLFEFSGLLGFGLTTRASDIDPGVFARAKTFDFSERLCSMLLDRCPNIQHLTIDTFIAWPSQIRCLTFGQWPKLCSLTLGQFVIEKLSLSKPSITDFLSVHPQLESFTISNAARFSFRLHPCLNLSVLPFLKSFGGAFSDISLRNPSLLKNLRLDIYPLRGWMIMAACNRLRTLTSLTSLVIWLDLGSFPDDVQPFAQLLTCCPQLLHLDVTIGSSFDIARLSVLLLPAPHLETLRLTVQLYNLWPTHNIVAAIVLKNPTLRELSFRKTLSSVWPCHHRIRDMATYEVVPDEYGIPIRLMVYQSRIGKFGKRFAWRYRHRLRNLPG